MLCFVFVPIGYEIAGKDDCDDAVLLAAAYQLRALVYRYTKRISATYDANTGWCQLARATSSKRYGATGVIKVSYVKWEWKFAV